MDTSSTSSPPSSPSPAPPSPRATLTTRHPRAPTHRRTRDMPEQPSNRQVMDAVQDVKRIAETVARDFQSFQATLPELVMPRREAEQRFGGLDQNLADHRTRLSTLEEWRLAETRAAAERQAAMQAQIQASVLAATKETAQTREESLTHIHAAVVRAMTDTSTARAQAIQDVSASRKDLDARTIALYGALIFLLLGWLFSVSGLSLVHR